MPIINPTELEETIAAIFVRHGTPATLAQKLAASLVKSNLTGHDSHGVILTPVYVKKIQDGVLFPEAKPEIRKTEGAITAIDCRYGFGHFGALLGAKTVVSQAYKMGVATVTLENVNHVGRVGEYGEIIAAAGNVGFIIVSGTGPEGLVAPYGGTKRVFGTNPICWSFPRPGKPFPILVDMATSTIAAGKVSQAKWAGKQIRSGALLDKNGNPTQDPNDFYDGGTLIPVGEHKGGGLMFAIELMANLFCGFAPGRSKEHKLGNPVVMTAWDIAAFTDRERFERLLEELCERVKSNPPAPGFKDVMLPGEFEYLNSLERIKTGIEIPNNLWTELQELAR
ncbi:MAG: Ldh family oxidoreductase [Verrucomicrobia bacterium]|nr:Ldh family oxidoreductase [Verrucomicrobiota bacterium]